MGYLAEMHAMLCGLKVLVTTETINGLESARRALGGHGYSAFAGIGRLYADYLPAATYVHSIHSLFVHCLSVLKGIISCWMDKSSVRLSSHTAF